jgi:hypothetical protein
MTARTFSSIKTASRLVNGFAAAAIALAPSLSFGQDLKPMPVATTSDGITAETNCKDWHPGELMASHKCEILKGELIKSQNACIAQLVKFKKDEPARFVELGFGNVTRDIACNLASRLPKRAASLQ